MLSEDLLIIKQLITALQETQHEIDATGLAMPAIFIEHAIETLKDFLFRHSDDIMH
ncbi:hypothetical protein [Novosphingobium taihuense]|uniref:hypothetical protein n=1 Tax=Novosphingobium taihuense TaxID=260085 RepID=UPI00131506BE|nr:hypothetical protein [Novosphingobium taihuense]